MMNAALSDWAGFDSGFGFTTPEEVGKRLLARLGILSLEFGIAAGVSEVTFRILRGAQHVPKPNTVETIAGLSTMVALATTGIHFFESMEYGWEQSGLVSDSYTDSLYLTSFTLAAGLYFLRRTNHYWYSHTPAPTPPPIVLPPTPPPIVLPK